MMLLAIEGIAGSGKTTLRDRLLADAARVGLPVTHTGQFSWLSPSATRVLVRLRQGKPAAGPRDAETAARHDLELHYRYNISPALTGHAVIADRFILSTASVIALIHGVSAAQIAARLATAGRAPDTTVVLTTPAWICRQRLATRPGTGRFTDQPGTAERLQQLLAEAAAGWAAAPGRAILTLPCADHDDLDHAARICLGLLASEGQAARATR
jgi:dTMP kinase